MNQRWLLISVVIIALLSFSCDDNPSAHQSTSFFARVVNASGQPISGAAFHYMFELVPQEQLEKQSALCPSSVIRFTIPNASHVLLTIHRWYPREVLDTLVNSIQGAGTYTVQPNVVNYTNGLYLYRLAFDSTVIERTMALINLDFAGLASTHPFFTSDELGRLEIPIASFGFDVPLLSSTAAGDTVETVYVSRAVKVLLVKQGYQTLLQSVTIDANTPPGMKFVLYPAN